MFQVYGFFLLYSGGRQIICFSDIVIAEYLSIASGCEYSRMLFLDPGFSIPVNRK